jgi:hypothetical protein
MLPATPGMTGTCHHTRLFVVVEMGGVSPTFLSKLAWNLDPTTYTPPMYLQFHIWAFSPDFECKAVWTREGRNPKPIFPSSKNPNRERERERERNRKLLSLLPRHLSCPGFHSLPVLSGCPFFLTCI